MTEKTWVHPVAADPRYTQVKQLIAEGNESEAQRLEEQIWADVKAAGYKLYSFGTRSK